MAVMDTGDFRRLIKNRLLVCLTFCLLCPHSSGLPKQQRNFLLVVRRWKCSEALALLVLQTGVCSSWTLSAPVSCHMLVKFLRSWTMESHVGEA